MTVTVEETAVEPVATTTSLLAILPLHINGLLPSTLVAIVSQADGTPANGTVEFRRGGADGQVVATVPVRNGIASYRLGRLSRGLHTYTAVFVPADETVAERSVSGRSTVLVLF